MITDVEMVEAARKILKEGSGYIWGTWGQTWTAADQKKATRPQTIKYGSKWIGRKVYDCSGLIRRIMKDAGINITHSSRTQYTDHCRQKGKLIKGRREDGKPLLPASGVFLESADGHMHHVGLYVGGGMVIEAAGTNQGVVTSGIEKWDRYGVWKDCEYTGGVRIDMMTVRNGSQGDYVATCQRLLQEAGYDVGNIDGVCGKQTVAAIKLFQRDNGLEADGVCGPATWAKLMPEGEEPERDPEQVDLLVQLRNMRTLAVNMKAIAEDLIKRVGGSLE